MSDNLLGVFGNVNGVWSGDLGRRKKEVHPFVVVPLAEDALVERLVAARVLSWCWASDALPRPGDRLTCNALYLGNARVSVQVKIVNSVGVCCNT